MNRRTRFSVLFHRSIYKLRAMNVLAFLFTFFLFHVASCQYLKTHYPNTETRIVDGESPYYCSETNSMYYSDLLGPTATICRCEIASNETYCATIPDETFTAAIVPLKNTKDKFVIASALRGEIIQWDGKSASVTKIKTIFDVEPGSGNLIERLRVDPSGKRLYFGTFHPTLCGGPANCSLYSWSESEGVKLRLTGLVLNAGFAWFYTGSQYLFYHLDGCTYILKQYSWNKKTGAIKYIQDIFDFRTLKLDVDPSAYIPVGLNVDIKGNVLVGLFRGYYLLMISPTSKTVVYRYRMPTQVITMGTFGGKYLNQLFVTSGGILLDINSGKVDRSENATSSGGALFELPYTGHMGFAGIPFEYTP